jgi:transposase InsO family protein
MALVELSVMEQRYDAVMAVLQEGWKITEVADRLGVTRQTIRNWIIRYEKEGGLPALADRSHRPKTSCSHQIPSELEALICEIRREHPGWGPRRIEHQMRRAGVDPMPSRSSIYRCLKRHGLIELRRRRKRRDEFKRWQRERPMQLWQMDVMAGVMLDDGTELKIVTGIDDHSRFCVAAGVVAQARSKAVCEVLATALSTHGIPDEILTDNGRVFTGRFGPHPVEVLFDRICRENGNLSPSLGDQVPDHHRKDRALPPECPQRVPRRPHLQVLGPCPEALHAWVNEYNNERPHQALDMATPTERFVPTRATNYGQLVTIDSMEGHRGQWILRRIGSNGCLSVDNHVYSVGNAYKDQLADVFVDGSVIQVWSRNHLIKTLARTRTGPVRKIRSDGLHVKPKQNTEGKASGDY